MICNASRSFRTLHMSVTDDNDCLTVCVFCRVQEKIREIEAKLQSSDDRTGSRPSNSGTENLETKRRKRYDPYSRPETNETK